MFVYPFTWRGFVVIEDLVILPCHIDTCMYWQAVQLNPLFQWDINRFSIQKWYTDWSIKYIRKPDHCNWRSFYKFKYHISKKEHCKNCKHWSINSCYPCITTKYIHICLNLFCICVFVSILKVLTTEWLKNLSHLLMK